VRLGLWGFIQLVEVLCFDVFKGLLGFWGNFKLGRFIELWEDNLILFSCYI